MTDFFPIEIADKVRFEIVRNFRDTPLIIRDLGPWDMYKTITNAPEAVVHELVKRGVLPDGRRLLYYDSEGVLDELVMKDGKFKEFRFVQESRE